MIVASFQSQYGIRLSRDLEGMKWSEFKALLSGLDSSSPLGKIIGIRSETDPQRLKLFSRSQRDIRSRWMTRKAKAMPRKDIDKFLKEMQKAFQGMSESVP